jgi:hypothetical protein
MAVAYDDNDEDGDKMDNKKVKSRCSRFWLWLVLFFAAMVTSLYTANLTAHIFPIQPKIPSLQNYLTKNVGAIRASSDVKYVRDIEGFHFLKELNLKDAVPSICNNSIKLFFGPRVILEYLAKSNCAVYVPSSSTEFELRREKVAFPVQKGSPLLEAINSEIQKMWDFNYLVQLERRHFDWPSPCQEDEIKDQTEKLDYKQLLSLFTTLYVVLFICLVVGLLRNVYSKYQEFASGYKDVDSLADNVWAFLSGCC